MAGFKADINDIFMHLASASMEKYFVEYSGIKAWIENAKVEAQKQGFCKSIFGRIEPLPDIYSKHKNKKEEAIRQSVNMPVQSAASDITQKAIFRLYKWILSNPEIVNKWGLLMVNTVHDSIVFECYTEYVEEACKKIKEIMEDISHLPWMKCCPKADFEFGPSYGELEELEI